MEMIPFSGSFNLDPVSFYISSPIKNSGLLDPKPESSFIKKRLVNTHWRDSRPALSLEGERSNTQAGLLAYSHRLPLLPSFLPVESWSRLLLTVTGSHRTCTGFPIHP